MNAFLSNSNATEACWAVVPAAGSGRRMGHATPKQYLPLAGKTVIEHTLCVLDQHPAVSGIVLVLAPGDRHWPTLAFEGRVPLVTVDGGEERSESVLRGLWRLRELTGPRSWTLVHDAARPCLRTKDLDALVTALSDHPVGGLLGVPLTDTLKRLDAQGDVIETLQRSGVWRALTPQMFRLDELTAAMEQAAERRIEVTDEASAMELAGYVPHMVEGSADNIKVTTLRDLALAERLLNPRENGGCG